MGTQLPEEWRQYGDMPVSEFTRFYPELHKNKQENRTVGDVFGANLLKEIEPYKDMPYSDYLLLQPHLNKKKEDKLDNMTLGELFGNDEKKAARYYPDFPLSTTIGMLKKLGRITDMDMEYLKLIGE